MSNRPKVKIKRDWWDNTLEGIALLALLISILVPIYYYGILPDTIPVHFDFSGEPDSYGSKATLFFLMSINTGLFLLLFFVAKIPHRHNYLVEITEENAKRQYRISARLIRVMNAVVCSFFAYVTLSTVSISLEKSISLGSYSVILLIVVISAVMFFFVSRSFSSQ